MSYTDDAVKAKLSALNETQDSIVGVAQWVMFHRRYADRSAQLWLQRLKDSTSAKRLNLVYLANEVVQQSKARKKDDFLTAFSPIIAEATGITAKGATNDILQKLRRVVEVWRQRQIFDQAVQEAAEARIEESDKSQSRLPSKKPLLGGSLFSDANSTVPTELQPLVPLQQSLSKASLTIKPHTTKADTEYAALNDGSQPIPTPPMHAARLSTLIKSLANAEDAVAESLKIRKALVAELERLLETNRDELAVAEAQYNELSSKKAAMTQRRHEVEDHIMRGLSSDDASSSMATNAQVKDGGVVNDTNVDANHHAEEFARPEIERFTPPIESTTPPGLPPSLPHTDGADEYERPDYEELTPPPQPIPQQAAVAAALPALQSAPIIPPVPSPSSSSPAAVAAVVDPRRRPRANLSSPANGVGGSMKKRKLSEHEDELGDGGDAMAGLDADVVGMLG